jgi:hypothetical protein
MKREHEQEEAASLRAQFFSLDNAVSALCDGELTPLLVAKLLQLSRRVRRLVWDYFSSPERYAVDVFWAEKFGRALLPYRESHRVIGTMMVWNMYPAFVPHEDGMSVVSFVTQPLADPDKLMALRPGFYNRDGDPACKKGFPGYDCGVCHKRDLFVWYIVADAMICAFDTMIAVNHRRKWDEAGGIATVHDRDLLMCAL